MPGETGRVSVLVHGPAGLVENVPAGELERQRHGDGPRDRGRERELERRRGDTGGERRRRAGDRRASTAPTRGTSARPRCAVPPGRSSAQSVSPGPHAPLPGFSGSTTSPESRIAAASRSRRAPVCVREVGLREAGRVSRRPGEAPVVARLRARRAEVAERVHLRRQVRGHLLVRAPSSSPMRSRAATRRSRAGCTPRAGKRARARSPAVLPPRARACAGGSRSGTRGGRDVGTPGTAWRADVAVDLLRPVADVRRHVRPEGRVGEPGLQRVLVDADVARPLPEADDERRAAASGACRRPRTGRAGTRVRSSRALPSPRRTAEVSSFSAQLSPRATS